MVDIVKNNLNKIIDACKKHHVRTLYVFGSASRNTDFKDKSDIDFLVEFDYTEPTNNENVYERVENLEKLELLLKNITNREIDLVQEKNIRNKFLKYFINKDKKLLYALS